MAKLFYNILKNISFNNATPSPTSGSSGSSRGAVNRDPKTVKARRVGYQINAGGGGGGRDDFEEHDVDLAAISEAIRIDSYLTQGTMKYEELIFKSGWALHSKNEQALEYLQFRLDMMEVATGTPMEDLFQGIARDIVWSSNCFIVKARARNGVGLPPGVTLTPILPSREPVVGYFILPPQTMTISRDANGTVLRYQQEVDGGGDAIQFAPEDMIHIKVNSRSGSAYGDPWLAPVIEDIRLLRKIEENASLLLYKHIFPMLKYKVGLDKAGFESTDEEVAEAQSMVDGMGADSIFVMPERHDVEAINVDAIDGNPYLTYFENRVFSGMGLSQVDFGRGDTANRNTADAMGGQKADRVKGWQKVIQTAIDTHMVDELLVEGGFDPLINPEFDVDFIFNEIEMEREIAKENHELAKFNGNIQTWEETRTAIGKEPVADETRLHYQMIGAYQSEAAMNSVDNKNQPENQDGKRAGPKRTTEFVESTMNGITTKESNKKTSEFVEMLSNQVDELHPQLDSSYSHMKSEIVKQLEFRQNKKSYPLESVSTIYAFNQLETDRFNQLIEKQAKNMLRAGIAHAESIYDRNIKLDVSLPVETIKLDIEEQIQKMQSSIKNIINNRLSEATSEEEIIGGITSIFEAMRFKVKTISKSILARSYNYGFILALISEGEKHASVFYEGDCSTCKSKSKEAIELKQLSSLDEVAIFYRIPPWHPNCECEVTQFKGGEM